MSRFWNRLSDAIECRCMGIKVKCRVTICMYIAFYSLLFIWNKTIIQIFSRNSIDFSISNASGVVFYLAFHASGVNISIIRTWHVPSFVRNVVFLLLYMHVDFASHWRAASLQSEILTLNFSNISRKSK